MNKNNDLTSMEKRLLWLCVPLCAEERKVKLNFFSNPEEEKRYLYKRMMNNKATSLEIMKLSYLTGVTNKEEYNEFLDICARYCLENEEDDD